ncbi:hypothetical protein GCM10007989_22170 [Devosia pacifica]|uniref:Uncharacterized protein n=2 Tax=Devosia pacifica TaxID=1335967 RepID=A0A918S6T1_9HYPH|nr:hypothetical protein GCM10007989_22170 [Devosia pacifica]
MQFSLNSDDLYVIAKGAHVLWVGSSEELVVDPQSRARFRLALDCADRAYRVCDCGSESARLSTIWDLEGAEPENARHAA